MNQILSADGTPLTRATSAPADMRVAVENAFRSYYGSCMPPIDYDGFAALLWQEYCGARNTRERAERSGLE